MPIANLRSIAPPRVSLRELNLNMLEGGPIMALPMQEGAGVTVEDISGFGNDGTFGAGAAAPSWHQLPSGLWYLDFDYTQSQYVHCPISPAFESHTFIVWFKVPSLSGHAVNVDLAYLGILGSRIAFSHTAPPYTLTRWRDAGGAYSYKNLTGNFAANIWHQLVERFDKDAQTLDGFLDGVIGVHSIGVTNYSAFNTLRLGYANLADYFDGSATLPGLYNRALSDREILNFCNRTKHLFGIFNGNILARELAVRQLAVLR